MGSPIAPAQTHSRYAKNIGKSLLTDKPRREAATVQLKSRRDLLWHHLGWCHGILQKSGDGAANGPMSTLDPNTTNTNDSSARTFPCWSHHLSLLWWWTHPAPMSWMMQPVGSVHSNPSRLSTHPQPQPPLQLCPSRVTCSLKFPCSWVFQVALVGVTEPWVTHIWSDPGGWWGPWV